MKSQGPDERQQEVVSREITCAQQFRQRRRTSLGRHVIWSISIIAAIASVFVIYGGQKVSSWLTLPVIGAILLGACIAWTRSSPACPNCRKNITTCRASYCHVCGEPLKAGRCAHCGVLQSWRHMVASSVETSGNREPITYCPSCAVRLDTDLYRWLGNGNGG